MLKLFTILILFISILGTSLLSVTTVFTKHMQNFTNQSDLIDLSEVKNTIVNNIVYDGNNKLVPYGINGSKYHEIPSWLTFKTNNAYGIPYVYCPYSEVSTSSTTKNVLNPDSSTYNIETINNLSTSDRDYVSKSGKAPFNGILAIIISPHNQKAIPNCSDVVFSNGAYTVPNGFVEVVHADSVLLSDLNKIESYSLSVLSDTDASVEDKLLYWNAKQPSKMTITLKSNDKFMLTDGNIYKNKSIDKKSIYLIGDSSSIPSYLEGSSMPSVNTFENVDIYFKNIEISNDVKFIFKNSNIYIDNSSLSNVEYHNSNVYISNAKIDNIKTNDYALEAIHSNIYVDSSFSINDITQNSTVYLFNSNLNFNENATVNIDVIANSETFQLVGSRVNSYKTTFNITSSNSSKPFTLFTVDGSSTLTMFNNDVNMPQSTAFLSTYGTTNISYTDISLEANSDYGIVVSNGGVLSLQNSEISNDTNTNQKVLVGISDQGANQIYGDSNNIYAVTCTKGNLFEDEYNLNFIDNSYNGSSATTQDETLTFNVRKYFNKLTYNCF